MNAPPVIAVRGLGKSYRVYRHPIDRLKELLLPASHGARHRVVNALDEVEFELARGDRLGILGVNGSGKSTLLRILAGVLEPTRGTVTVNGRVAALLELGSGFSPELTGRENVFQQAMVMGSTRAEAERLYPAIVGFAEIGEAIDQPIKTYSSGMTVRLAFACAVFAEPDILIIDEALAVGDSYFQAKCFYKIKAMIERGCTFLYVTHNPDSVRTLCNRAILLDHGRIIREGSSADVTEHYQSLVFERQVREQWFPAPAAAGTAERARSSRFTSSEAFAQRVSALRQGSGRGRITDVRLLDDEERERAHLELGETGVIRVSFETREPLVQRMTVGVGVCDASGVQVLQFTSRDEGLHFHGESPAGHYVLDFAFENCLAAGEYRVNVGLAQHSSRPDIPGQTYATDIWDSTFGGLVFRVAPHPTRAVHGKVSIPVRVTQRD